ncbi:phosphomannomutase/phosphoglucomutase [Pedobacter glucosidilyticus]|nr:phosphoglucosamine mutase [Pedobacter glucosidilyticus]KHJ39232.1 phosphomannomutase/phosphoglucomutase [Pedobacter glucosidilyticus]
MTLIKSISGIRGTIGGKAGEGLTPPDILKFTAAFGRWVLAKTNNPKILIGRDARISGAMVNNLVTGTLQSLGIDVIDIGLSTTPTVEIVVPLEEAGGGIILTASHNPKEWNALKLLNHKGEFISDADGKEVLQLAEQEFDYASVDQLGKVYHKTHYVQQHIAMILDLPLVDREAIKAANFSVVVDAVNSSGGIFVPQLLKALGVNQVHELFCEPDGHFPHNPEPLAEHLTELSALVIKEKAHLGIAVDPDVDRLCFVCEDGQMFGEEYTLVAVADYILQHQPGATVSNLSSTRALRDITRKAGETYAASAVGEVNVVNLMKANNAVIGGEGNGGIIYPELHYGRDALVGIALFLTYLAKQQQSVSALRKSYPAYYMSKNKITLSASQSINDILEQLKNKYQHEDCNTIDGLKIDFKDQWVHLRKSNTEPIIRVYAEAKSEAAAVAIANQIMEDVKALS